ncbi:MAG: exosortase/archaeosortase family protein [Phycisphaerae bacterium]|nr:exosortase/archaeosortase family protein [Phycisphaerae bacterium]
MNLPRFWLRNGWTRWHILAAVAMLGAGFAVTWEAWREMLSIGWRDEESNHVFLVPVIAVWLIWVRRDRFRQCCPRGTVAGPAFIAIGAILSWIGYYYAIESFWHAGSILIVVGCLLSVTGVDVLFRFLPAFIVLIFLVPVPGTVRMAVAVPLQGVLAQVTQFIFDIVGVDVARQGNLLSINGQEVAIAEACNGMRMVFTLMLVSIGVAFGTPLRNYVRLIIILASPLSAILCNVIRMIPTVALYGYASQPIAKQFHDWAGWIMLFVAFLLLMGIIGALKWAVIPVRPYTLAYD